MKTIKTIPAVAGLLLAAVSVGYGQTNVDPSALRRAGEREFTIGGGGAANKRMDDSFGGVNFSYGWYATENAAWVIRQSINYTNPDVGGTDWFGATRLAYDYHLGGGGSWRPFVGVNVGGVYGDAVRDTFVAGLEAGLKFYVQPRTFIFAMGEYGWFFRNARSIDNRFRDGSFNWGIGLGYNF